MHPLNRGGIGASVGHCQTVTRSVLQSKFQQSQYRYVVVIEVPTKELDAFLTFIRNLLNSMSDGPPPNNKANFAAITNNHLVLSLRKSKVSNRKVLTPDGRKQNNNMFDDHLMNGMCCIVLKKDTWDKTKIIQYIMNGDNMAGVTPMVMCEIEIMLMMSGLLSEVESRCVNQPPDAVVTENPDAVN